MQEDGFLRDIIAHPNDPVPRLIYADWLEERGDPRGEFLRLEVRLHESQNPSRQRRRIRARLQHLRQVISQTWLAQLDRATIENCSLRFQFQCPERWEDLRETEEGRVRFCESCQKNVYHCATVEEARERARRGGCVAVDSRLTRQPGDIAPPRPRFSVGLLVLPHPPHNTEDGPEREPDIHLHVPSEAREEYQPSREHRRRERQASRQRRQRRHKRGG